MAVPPSVVFLNMERFTQSVFLLKFYFCVKCSNSWGIDPFSVSGFLMWLEHRWRQKDSPDHFTNTSYKVYKLFLFNNDWRKSDFTCICKVIHCPGLRLLFEKVNFNGRKQIGVATRSLKGWTI